MRFSKSTGASLVFAHQHHEHIETWIRTFGEKTAYTGQVGFDFIESDALYAIECNPRLTSGVHTLCEHDLLSLLKHSTKKCMYGSRHPQSLKTALMLYAPQEIHAQGFSSWLWSIFRTQDVLFRLFDPIPGLLWPLGYLQLLWRAWSEGISVVEASTFDIEWNAEK